jgi:uncharacterized protein DUF2786
LSRRDKERQTGQRGEGRWREQAAPPTERFAGMLWDAARRDAVATLEDAVEELAVRHAGHAHLVEQAADVELRESVSELFAHGWQPRDVYQLATRRVGEPAVSLLVDAIAAEIGQRAAAAVHPRWRDQLGEIAATLWWQQDRPQLGQWARRHGRSGAEALAVVVELLALMLEMPSLPEIPLPETPRSGVDEKMLARVRALLAKAESTQFPEEAEALSAKAQELMSRYSFERALVEPVERRQASSRRFWLDNPYLGPKSSLVSAVATANRCRAVSYERLGFVALVGHEVDLDIVELLATSLLVQATEAMIAAGHDHRLGGRSRSRPFRQSFLLAYAARIGERLAEADRATSEHLVDDRLLPVLARRGEEVEALFGEMFPDIVLRRRRISDDAGWHAGRAAAELARLDLESTRLPR